MTSSNLNLVDSDKDLWNTLVSKYVSFYNQYTYGFDKEILWEFGNEAFPKNTHIGVDLVYDLIVEDETRLIQGRRTQPDVPDYNNMTNVGVGSFFQVGYSSFVEINQNFIERKAAPCKLRRRWCLSRIK